MFFKAFQNEFPSFSKAAKLTFREKRGDIDLAINWRKTYFEACWNRNYWSPQSNSNKRYNDTIVNLKSKLFSFSVSSSPSVSHQVPGNESKRAALDFSCVVEDLELRTLECIIDEASDDFRIALFDRSDKNFIKSVMMYPCGDCEWQPLDILKLDIPDIDPKKLYWYDDLIVYTGKRKNNAKKKLDISMYRIDGSCLEYLFKVTLKMFGGKFAAVPQKYVPESIKKNYENSNILFYIGWNPKNDTLQIAYIFPDGKTKIYPLDSKPSASYTYDPNCNPCQVLVCDQPANETFLINIFTQEKVSIPDQNNIPAYSRDYAWINALKLFDNTSIESSKNYDTRYVRLDINKPGNRLSINLCDGTTNETTGKFISHKLKDLNTMENFSLNTRILAFPIIFIIKDGVQMAIDLDKPEENAWELSWPGTRIDQFDFALVKRPLGVIPYSLEFLKKFKK